jgi:hypothetical protein
MASGTITGTTANAYIESKIEWSSTSSVANNNSTVTANLYYRRTNYYTGIPTGGTGTFTITIDGQSGSVSASFNIPNSGSWAFACSVTKTVAHNADGAKSITISAAGGLNGTSLSATYCSGTAVLDTIPRQATLTSAQDFTDEQNPTITYSNPAGNAVTSLQACISLDGSADDIKYRDINKTGTSYKFTLTEAERNVLRNATTSSNTREVKFFVMTVIGGVTHYSITAKTLTIVNANPTFTNDQVSYADVNDGVVSITGNNQHIVQNQSSLTATFGAATGNKGASITGYTLTLNGVTKTATASGSVNFGTVNSSRDATLSVTAKDSRGNTTTVSKNVTVLAWSPPVLNATVERLNNYEDETYLTVNASISSVNGKNDMLIVYSYKQVGNDYYDAIDMDIGNNEQLVLVCDKNYAYSFEIAVADLFYRTVRFFHLDKGRFPLFIDTEKNAVGVNAFPSEGEAMRVAGGVSVFEDGIVLMSGTKKYKITVSESGSLVVAEFA